MSDPLASDDEDEGVDEGWLATFADVSMLLLTFFVLLLSMSTTEPVKTIAALTSINEAFGGNSMQHAMSVPSLSASDSQLSGAELEKTLLDQQRATFNSMRSAIMQASLDTAISASIDEGIITLRMPDGALFKPHSAEIQPGAEKTLAFMLDLLSKTRDQTINIRGYTDDAPMPPTGRFKDNWELSSIRALNVLRYFMKHGIEPTRMTATGLADLNPLAPNTTEENRAKNRRVEFIFERHITK